MKEDMHPDQLRAAKALVDRSRKRFAETAGMTARALARIESGETFPRPATLAAIRTAVEAVGVKFIEQNGGGPEMRLQKVDQ